MFLSQKGYAIDTINNGDEALDMFAETNYDIVFLDENMPGLSGLETLRRMKSSKDTIPVVMITKSEEEHIMEDAIGAQIADYLIKPVNPNQILLTLKKCLDSKKLVSEKTTMNYQQEFRQIAMEMSSINSPEAWAAFYRKLIYWELALERLDDEGMHQILTTQKSEANQLFARFISKNYEDWMVGAEDAPLLSHQVFRRQVVPALQRNEKVFLILIDNLRFDQWKVLQPVIEEYYKVDREDTYYSILPTATQYARNAFFAGTVPTNIKKKFPKLWVTEQDDDGKNLHEEEFLRAQLDQLGLRSLKMAYNKITNLNGGKKLVDQFANLKQNDLNVVVYNFVDMLSHSKTEMEVIKELADNDRAYRSLTLSWFKNSPLLEIIRLAAQNGLQIVLTTDHGTINVEHPIKIVGDRTLTTNLRYKLGRNMGYDAKEVFEVTDPESIGVPKSNFTDVIVFGQEKDFFAYPNNFNHYVNYFRNTYQHGGVSLEEMIIPFVWLKPR